MYVKCTTNTLYNHCGFCYILNVLSPTLVNNEAKPAIIIRWYILNKFLSANGLNCLKPQGKANTFIIPGIFPIYFSFVTFFERCCGNS